MKILKNETHKFYSGGFCLGVFVGGICLGGLSWGFVLEPAPGLELDIKLTDDKPFQKNYASIHRPLYGEVEGYIEDLLNRKFVKSSKFPYLSPCACV